MGQAKRRKDAGHMFKVEDITVSELVKLLSVLKELEEKEGSTEPMEGSTEPMVGG